MHGAIRVGAAFPSGGFDAGSSLSDNAGTQTTVIIDAGARLRPQDDLNAGWMFGGYLGVGFGGTGSTNDALRSQFGLSSGSAVSVHFGPEVQYRFVTHSNISPWVGYGLGLEVLRLSFDKGNTTDSLCLVGFQFARPQIGVDWIPSPWFGLGLYTEVSFAQFSRGTAYVDQAGVTQSTADVHLVGASLHEWIGLGVRGVLLP